MWPIGQHGQFACPSIAVISITYDWRWACTPQGRGNWKCQELNYWIPLGTVGRRSIWRAISATSSLGNGKNLVKEQNAEDSEVGERGSGLYAERPNGRRIYSRVGKTN